MRHFRWTAAGTEALSHDIMITIGYIRPAPGFSLSANEQRAAVAELARRKELTLRRIYADSPGRRTTGRAALLRSMQDGRVSTVITASICSLATTLPSLLRVLTAIAEARVALLITDEDGQRHVDALLAAVPILNAARAGLHREAAAIGRARARSKGVQFGRPRISEAKVIRVREALDAGAGIREAARRAGVSPATVIRLGEGQHSGAAQ